MIRNENGKWKLYTSDGGRVLGTHASRAEALAQERAVQANKHKQASIDMDKLAEDVAQAAFNKLMASVDPRIGENIIYWLQSPLYRQIYPTPFDIQTTVEV